jgi:hypothetical protein
VAGYLQWKLTVERIRDGDAGAVAEAMSRLFGADGASLTEAEMTEVHDLLVAKRGPSLPQRTDYVFGKMAVGNRATALVKRVRPVRPVRPAREPELVARTRRVQPQEVRDRNRAWRRRYSSGRFGVLIPGWLIPHLTDAQIAIANALGEIFLDSYRSGNKLTCEQYVAQIARKCGLVKRTVQKAIKRLMELKVLTRLFRRTGWINGTNLLCPNGQWANWLLKRLRVNGASPGSRTSFNSKKKGEDFLEELIGVLERKVFRPCTGSG